jgi:nicotinate-nucleotide--dimethylbenzimidazole phosphoribosyltransferase
MTTGTEEFGPDESGARAAAPGAGAVGGPQAAPWLAGGSVGYAEAMFGDPEPEAGPGRGPAGGRRRAAEPGAGAPPAFFERPGFEQAPGRGGFPPAGPQGGAFDAPTAEFYPGPLFEQPGFDQPAYEAGDFGQPGPGESGYGPGGFDQPGFDQPGFDQPGFEPAGFDPRRFGPGEFGQPGFEQAAYESGGYDRQPADQGGYDSSGLGAQNYGAVGHGPAAEGAARIPAQPQRSAAPNPADGLPTGAAQDRGAWTAAPPPRPRREPPGQREGSGLPTRPMPPQNQIPHAAPPGQGHGPAAPLRGPVPSAEQPQPGRHDAAPAAAPYPEPAGMQASDPSHSGQHHVAAPAPHQPHPAGPHPVGGDELSHSGRSQQLGPQHPAEPVQAEAGPPPAQPVSPMMTSQYGAAPTPTRPSVPDEPVPAREPLPVRGAVRDGEQSAVRQAVAAAAAAARTPAAQAGSPAAPRAQAAGRPAETLTPPRRTPAQRRPAAPAQEAPAPGVGAVPADPAPVAQAAVPPVAAPPAAAPAAGGEDLSRERLRSVAPVPAPREAAAVDARRGGFSALVAQPGADAVSGTVPPGPAEQAPDAEADAEEMVVPWQALAAPVDLAEARPAPTAQQAPMHSGGFAADPVAAAVPGGPDAAVQAVPAVAAEDVVGHVTAPGPRQAAMQPPAASPAPAAVRQGPGDQDAAESAPVPEAGAQQASAVRAPRPSAAEQQQPAAVDPDRQRATVPAPRGGRRRAADADQADALQDAAEQSAPSQRPVRQASAAAPGVPGDEERAPGYDLDALEAVYRVIHERRDVRNNFLSDDVPVDVLTRILEAAHTAPSVGFSQPWDFLVIRDTGMRQSIHELAVRQRRAYAASLPKARAKAFATMKVEAILETPVNIVVTCDPTRGGRHTLGRYTQAMMAPFSSCLAVENLWLAARAEGLGVGWVSFFDEPELAAVLDLPAHLQVVAYLCVGYVSEFPAEPELAGTGWAKRRPLAWAVHEERFGHRALPGTEPLSLLSETIDAIRPLDPHAAAAARARQARMTKPPGSLGVLEAVAEQLAGLAGVCPPPMPEPAAIAVFAGDHGVHAQGVTPWPQEVTAQMVGNFLAGGAVVNAFAKQVGAEVCVVDVGVAAQLVGGAGLVPRKIRFGTADMTQGPALTRAEAVEAVEAGIETARDLVAAGNRCLLTGDMGIANTTASAALIAAFTGASPAQVTGYGTGIDEQTYAHKVDVVRRALHLHRPDPQDPIGVLAAFGGLEHAALAGFILGAAALRVPVVLDGVIAGAAALVAQAFVPEATVACVAGHRSAEPGHALALEALGVIPLIDLELRLGEGSGAALALPLVGAAVRALREVATFDDAGVADASEHTAQPPTERDRV